MSFFESIIQLFDTIQMVFCDISITNKAGSNINNNNKITLSRVFVFFLTSFSDIYTVVRCTSLEPFCNFNDETVHENPNHEG